jgi:hypothetical protein
MASNDRIISEQYLKRKWKEAVVAYGTITAFTWRDLSHNNLSPGRDSNLTTEQECYLMNSDVLQRWV